MAGGTAVRETHLGPLASSSQSPQCGEELGRAAAGELDLGRKAPPALADVTWGLAQRPVLLFERPDGQLDATPQGSGSGEGVAEENKPDGKRTEAGLALPLRAWRPPNVKERLGAGEAGARGRGASSRPPSLHCGCSSCHLSESLPPAQWDSPLGAGQSSPASRPQHLLSVLATGSFCFQKLVPWFLAFTGWLATDGPWWDGSVAAQGQCPLRSGLCSSWLGPSAPCFSAARASCSRSSASVLGLVAGICPTWAQSFPAFLLSTASWDQLDWPPCVGSHAMRTCKGMPHCPGRAPRPPGPKDLRQPGLDRRERRVPHTGPRADMESRARPQPWPWSDPDAAGGGFPGGAGSLFLSCSAQGHWAGSGHSEAVE